MSVYDDLSSFPAAKDDPRGFRKFELTRDRPAVDVDLAAKGLGMTAAQIGLFNFGAAEWNLHEKDCFMIWPASLWPYPDFEGYRGSWFWVPGNAKLTPEGQGFGKLGDMVLSVEDDDDMQVEDSDDEDDSDDESDDDEEEEDFDKKFDEERKPVGKGDCEVDIGDCISSIAVLNGLHWKKVWDHPANADLKRVRKHPNILLPGDKVTAKEDKKDIQRGSDKRYRCLRKGVPGLLRLRFTLFGIPRKGEKYEIEVEGAKVGNGTLDGDGALQCSIIPFADNAVVYLGDDRERFEFTLGSLPPVTAISGLEARLANLNYYNGPLSTDPVALTDQTKTALATFKKRNFPDQKTEITIIRSQLVKRHGS